MSPASVAAAVAAWNAVCDYCEDGAYKPKCGSVIATPLRTARMYGLLGTKDDPDAALPRARGKWGKGYVVSHVDGAMDTCIRLWPDPRSGHMMLSQQIHVQGAQRGRGPEWQWRPVAVDTLQDRPKQLYETLAWMCTCVHLDPSDPGNLSMIDTVREASPALLTAWQKVATTVTHHRGSSRPSAPPRRRAVVHAPVDGVDTRRQLEALMRPALAVEPPVLPPPLPSNQDIGALYKKLRMELEVAKRRNEELQKQNEEIKEYQTAMCMRELFQKKRKREEEEFKKHMREVFEFSNKMHQNGGTIVMGRELFEDEVDIPVDELPDFEDMS